MGSFVYAGRAIEMMTKSMNIKPRDESKDITFEQFQAKVLQNVSDAMGVPMERLTQPFPDAYSVYRDLYEQRAGK